MAADPGSLAERLSESGRFDEPFYRACYGGMIPPGMSAIRHFLSTGLDQGLKPNAAFDPVLCRMRDPQPGRGEILAELLAQSPTGDLSAPDIPAMLPGLVRMPRYRPPERFRQDDPANLAAAPVYGRERSIDFTAGGRPYRMRVLAVQDFLDRLRQDRPFAYPRISHGDWDALYAFDHYRAQIGAMLGGRLSAAELDRLTIRLCDALLHNQQVYAENFLIEFIEDLRTRPRDPRFLFSVAFKGFPTADERLFEWSRDDARHPGDIERLRIFSEYVAPEEPLYDAILWKRWLISGGLADLPGLVGERPVIFMGADRLSGLGERWALRWFLHIPIPAAHAYGMRHALLDACRERIAEAEDIARRHDTRRPVFIMQGSSFAFWFMVRLFHDHPDIFYLDFGQALHPWFYDIREIPLLPWGKLFGPTIVRNTGLAPFYRARGIAEPVCDTLFGSAQKARTP